MSHPTLSRAFLATLLVVLSATVAADDLSIQRLTWAGLKLVADNTTVFVDPVGTDLWNGEAPEGLVPVMADTDRRYALITHMHNDHFDLATLKRVLGDRGYVICVDSMASHIASRGLKVIPAALYTPVTRGGFVFTAVPAADGFGDEQVSWIIARGDRRVLHAGDTLWHGKWNTLGMQYGPFDVVFLPINGARVAGEPATETPAVMTPAQAIDAAVLLRSRKLVPIHYGLDDPPNYVEVDEPVATLRKIALRRSVTVEHVLPGEFVDS